MLRRADLALDPAETDVARLRELTDGRGVDVAIEAVGIPDAFALCGGLLRPSGRLANVGVHGAPAQLHLEQLWIRDITVKAGRVDTYSMPTLLRLLARCQIDLRRFLMHRFGLDGPGQFPGVVSRPRGVRAHDKVRDLCPSTACRGGIRAGIRNEPGASGLLVEEDPPPTPSPTRGRAA